MLLSYRTNLIQRTQQGRPFILCFYVSTHWPPLQTLWTQSTLLSTYPHPLALDVIDQPVVDDNYLICRRSFQSMVKTGYYEQSWIQMNKDDIAEPFIINLIYCFYLLIIFERTVCSRTGMSWFNWKIGGIWQKAQYSEKSITNN